MTPKQLTETARRTRLDVRGQVEHSRTSDNLALIDRTGS
jgi:hypothetical protein